MTNAEANTSAAVAEQGAHVAPEKASSKKGASQKKGAPKGQKAAKGGKAKAAAPKKEAKTSKKAADWQAHSVRGFISTAAKKNRIKIESAKNETGDRVYKIAK